MTYFKRTQKTVLSVFILLTLSFSMNAQWNIPEDAKDNFPKSNPTFESVKTGKELFKDKTCLSCHGIPGEGKNNMAINAPDLGSSESQTNKTLGEIHWQISTGLGQMPSFKNILTHEEIWTIVFYIKSFDPGFKIKGDKITAHNGSIDLQINDSLKTILATATIIDNKGNSISAEGLEIIFSVKRIFGNLAIGDAVVTDKNGIAILNFPDDIPGDEKGKLELIVGFKDSDSFGTAINKTELNWGTHLHFVNPVLERTLWGPNDRVPLWLLFSYILVTGGVWLTILYVVFQITRIKKAGR